MSGTETSHILLHLLHPRTGSVFRPEIGTMHANPVTESYRFAQRDSQHILKFTGAFLKEKILQLYSVYCNAGHLKLFSRVRATLPQARKKTVTHGAVARRKSWRGGSSAIFAPFQNHIWHEHKNSIKMSFHTYISYLKFLRSKNLKLIFAMTTYCINTFVDG